MLLIYLKILWFLLKAKLLISYSFYSKIVLACSISFWREDLVWSGIYFNRSSSSQVMTLISVWCCFLYTVCSTFWIRIFVRFYFSKIYEKHETISGKINETKIPETAWKSRNIVKEKNDIWEIFTVWKFPYTPVYVTYVHIHTYIFSCHAQRTCSQTIFNIYMVLTVCRAIKKLSTWNCSFRHCERQWNRTGIFRGRKYSRCANTMFMCIY